MTYDELARLRVISKPSAERLVLRNHWRRQRGNDRTVRILVPIDSLSGDISGDASEDTSGDARQLLTGALAALETALMEANDRATEADQRAKGALTLVDRLGTQLADAGTRADEANRRAVAAEARSEANVQRADRAEARAEQERQAADRFRSEAEAAQEAAEALRQAVAKWWARGRLARLRAAWRGA
jgi:chromosome segregation ATPase